MTEFSAPSSGRRVLITIVVPILGVLIFSFMAARQILINPADRGLLGIQAAGAGLASWYLGWRWYGLSGLGLKGGRPLYAGIGFAALGWLIFLVVRFFTVSVSEFGSPDAGLMFVFILLFEAFCVQIWVYGLFFRATAEWRGPLTAAVASGLLFAAIGFTLFQESAFVTTSNLLLFTIPGLVYFTLWGIFYGIIRLRTGSFLGPVIIQTLQSWTAWHIMVPESSTAATEVRNLYLIMSIFYLILIWRLWPKTEEDYRL